MHEDLFTVKKVNAELNRTTNKFPGLIPEGMLEEGNYKQYPRYKILLDLEGQVHQAERIPGTKQ